MTTDLTTSAYAGPPSAGVPRDGDTMLAAGGTRDGDDPLLEGDRGGTAPAGEAAADHEPAAQEDIPIVSGEAVRWRRQAGARWNQGTVIRREADGSIAVRDGNSAWRSIPVERMEAQTVTKRGAKKWVPLAERGPVPIELTPAGPDTSTDTDTGTDAEAGDDEEAGRAPENLASSSEDVPAT